MRGILPIRYNCPKMSSNIPPSGLPPSWSLLKPFEWKRFDKDKFASASVTYRFDGLRLNVNPYGRFKAPRDAEWFEDLSGLVKQFTSAANQYQLDARILAVGCEGNYARLVHFETKIHRLYKEEKENPLLALFAIHRFYRRSIFDVARSIAHWNGLSNLIEFAETPTKPSISRLALLPTASEPSEPSPTKPETPESRDSTHRRLKPTEDP